MFSWEVTFEVISPPPNLDSITFFWWIRIQLIRLRQGKYIIPESKSKFLKYKMTCTLDIERMHYYIMNII